MAPELTVGLVVRDDPDGLVRSAASVLGQSWRGRTLLIIVDDGSSDETPDVAARLAARTGSVEMLRHERPAGFARARNRILDAARSRYVAWIDAGDVWHPRKLERQLRALEAARGASRVATCAAYSLAAGRASDETPQRSAHAAASPEIDLAPFSTLLGETAAFAAAGRLDESLHGLADEEFLRRVTAGGANLLLVEPETPLCALGARSERGAGVAGPADAPPTKRRPGARQRYAAFVRRAGATLLAANPLDPAHPAVVALVDLLTGSGRARLATFAPGLAALTAPAGPASPDADGPAPLTRIDRSVLTVVHACCAAGKLDRAEALLDAHRRRLGGRVHPRVIERLAAVHLAAGRAERAEAELVGALRRGNDDPALHLALADTYVRQGRWSDAIAHWERAPDTCRLGAGTGLATRIARAYREVGRPRDGWTVASRAAQRAPHDPALLHELDVCARRAADWPACLVCADAGASTGRVDAWGFLAGGNAPLTGRLAPAPSAELEIRLRVNGLPVAATRAAVVDDSIARFALNCAGLLDYLGDGDLLDVVAGDERVELPGGAASVMVHNGLPSRFAALERKLRQGYVFTKTGRLEAGHTDASKRAALDLYLEVAEHLETETGLPVFPFYGNLLGAIRENDFIAHDVDGFDMLVLCRSREPAGVKAELERICAVLRERGYELEARPWCVYIRPPGGGTPFLDLSYGWFDDADALGVSFGWRYAAVRGRDAFIARRHCRIMDRDVRVPGNAEAVLEQLYGPSWRIPDQGFAPLANLTRDMRYWLTDAEIAAITRKAAKPAA